MNERGKAVAILAGIVAAGVVLLAGAMAVVDRIGGAHDRVVMGSKAFTESIILSEIASQWLEESGIAVERRFNLGATNICFEALRSGAIDLYPEYTGTGLMAILHHPVVEEPKSALAIVRTRFRDDYDLEWMSPLGFDNNYALAVPERLSRELGIVTISDLLKHPELRAGFASEFLARDDGWPGLEKKYGLRFKSPPGSMEAGLMYKAAATGQIDVISAYSTDGRIKTQHLVVLDDDRHFFPPYQAVFVVRRSMLRRESRVGRTLEELAGIIHEDAMRSMNADVDFGSRSYVDVARDFLGTVRPQLLRARQTGE